MPPINKTHGKIRTRQNVKVTVMPFFTLFKRHYCSKCKGRLRRFFITQTLWEFSPEAKGKNLTWRGIWGKPITYKFAIFKCTECGQQISIPDQFHYEKPKSNAGYYFGIDCNGDEGRDDYHVYLASAERAKKEAEE